jgi:hypothetical protein
MVTLDRAWCVLCALTARKPAHGHGHGPGQKAEKWILALAQTKAQERLLLFWVGCVCPMGVLYEPTGAIQDPQPKTTKTKMRAYLPG